MNEKGIKRKLPIFSNKNNNFLLFEGGWKEGSLSQEKTTEKIECSTLSGVSDSARK